MKCQKPTSALSKCPRQIMLCFVHVKPSNYHRKVFYVKLHFPQHLVLGVQRFQLSTVYYTCRRHFVVIFFYNAIWHEENVILSTAFFQLGTWSVRAVLPILFKTFRPDYHKNSATKEKKFGPTWKLVFWKKYSKLNTTKLQRNMRIKLG
jgi:hypothetical protein